MVYPVYLKHIVFASLSHLFRVAMGCNYTLHLFVILNNGKPTENA